MGRASRCQSRTRARGLPGRRCRSLARRHRYNRVRGTYNSCGHSAGQMPTIPVMEKAEATGVAPFDLVVDGSVAPSATEGGSTSPASIGGTPAGGADPTQLDPRSKAPLLTPATKLAPTLVVSATESIDQTGLARLATKPPAVQGGANEASLKPYNVYFNVRSFCTLRPPSLSI